MFMYGTNVSITVADMLGYMNMYIIKHKPVAVHFKLILVYKINIHMYFISKMDYLMISNIVMLLQN